MPDLILQNPHRLPLALIAACLLLPAALRGQESLGTHQNSLGQTFVPVPGTTVRFATTEVRVSDFKAFVKATNHPWNYTPHFSQSEDHPAVGVTLRDAQAFCAWLTASERAARVISEDQQYRLPTNNEWGAAAGIVRIRKAGVVLSAEESLGDQKRFPWGLEWPPPLGAANLAEEEIPDYTDSHIYTAPVGSSAQSEDGLHDLAGNVWEWTAESTRATSGHLRGGSWAYFNPECLRSNYLYEVPADLQAPTVGFRLVYEDRQLTARLLAQNEKQREEQLRERQTQIMAKADTSDEELAAMRLRLAGKDNTAGTAASQSTANLSPAKPGAPHTNSIGMEFKPVPGSATLLAATEVTARVYELYLKAGNQTWTDKPAHITTPEHPVAGITWKQAGEFCDWLTRSQKDAGLLPEGASYRMPTDKEWSAAAGLSDEPEPDPKARDGKNTTHFPWSPPTAWPPPARAANLDAPKIPGYSDSTAYTCAVTTNSPNDFGFYELGGNVSEWCLDPWPDAPNDRVYRGASWLSSEREECLTSNRSHAPFDAPRGSIGFRCALEFRQP